MIGRKELGIHTLQKWIYLKNGTLSPLLTFTSVFFTSLVSIRIQKNIVYIQNCRALKAVFVLLLVRKALFKRKLTKWMAMSPYLYIFYHLSVTN